MGCIWYVWQNGIQRYRYQGRQDKNVKEAHLRRFYLHFDSREHLTCVLFALFGGDDNARKFVEEFFDGSGRFCPEEEPELPHRVIDHNRMDIDSINGLSPAQPTAQASRVLFDNDHKNRPNSFNNKMR